MKGWLGSRIGPRRRTVQWLCSVLLLALPFLRVGGESLLRLDAPSRTLLFFGSRIRIEEFYLFLIVLLILVFGFLFITMLFGRVWCGWLCPQTTLSDLADWFDSRIAKLVPAAPVAAVLKQLAYLVIACIVSCNLVWYFIAPWDFFRRLFSGQIGALAGMTLISVLLLVYLDLALVRRTFCKTVCPYGRIQLMTTDQGTLTLGMDPKLKEACLRCGACVRSCPMEIDIRNGLQIECINCGRCLDACREVMEKTGGKGLIRYSFGNGESGGPRISGRTVLIGTIVLALTAVLAFGVATRKEATLKVQRVPDAEVKRLSDGTVVNFFNLYLENRSAGEGTFSLQVAPVSGYQVQLVGQVGEITLPPNGSRKVSVAVKILPAPQEKKELEVTLVKEGKVVAASPLPLLTQ